MYKKILKNIKEIHLLKKQALGDIKKTEQNTVMARKPHFIFSAENPLYPENIKYNMKHDDVVKFLKGKGYNVEQINGHYGKPERSILVHNPTQRAAKHLLKLSKDLGQESSIYSNGYDHEMHFHGGENAGYHAKGQGTAIHKRKPDDFYSTMSDGTHFTHQFNFDTLHEPRTSALSLESNESTKSEYGISDLAKNDHIHKLINASPKTKLIHFSPTEGLQNIDPDFQGKRIKDAGSKYGKPEHPASFFYLENTVPEQVVTSGSKSKYVSRLGDNKLYDIGTDPEGIHQSLKDSGKTLNPGLVTRDEYHGAIKNKGYHGFYNSTHDREDMRNVVGMYNRIPVEKEVPFHPRDMELATDQSYEQHHSVLKSENDEFEAKLNRIAHIRKTTKPKKMKLSLEHIHQDPHGVANAEKTFHFTPDFKVSPRPVKVGVHVKTGKMYLLDGYHRAMAAQKAGQTHIDAEVIPTKGVLGAKHPQYKSPRYKTYHDQFFHEVAGWDEMQEPKQRTKIVKNSRPLLIDEEELADIEKAVNGPSKYIGFNRLQRIKQDNNIGEGGKEYDAGELNDAINERGNAVARKMVTGAQKQEKQMAADAEDAAAGGGFDPSMLPPPIMRPAVNAKPAPAPIQNENANIAPNVKLNAIHGKTIANAYQGMAHNPSDPQVQQAYTALINETKDQFKDMVKNGFSFTSIKPGQENPYKNSKDLHSDIKNNKHLHFFPTEQGFGSSGDNNSHHPMLQPTEFKHNGKTLLANDLFRIVHDYRGHHLGGGSGFGPKGEHQAYLTHKKDFSPLAQKALATETLMQNSFVNYGPNAERNRKDPSNTIYADQKANIAPDWIVNGKWHE